MNCLYCMSPATKEQKKKLHWTICDLAVLQKTEEECHGSEAFLLVQLRLPLQRGVEVASVSIYRKGAIVITLH